MNEVQVGHSQESTNLSFQQQVKDRLFSRSTRYETVFKGKNVGSVNDSKLLVMSDSHNIKKAERTMGAIVRTQAAKNGRILLLVESVEKDKKPTTSDLKEGLEGFLGPLPEGLTILGWDDKQAYKSIAARIDAGVNPREAVHNAQDNAQRDESLVTTINSYYGNYDQVIVIAGSAHVKAVQTRLISNGAYSNDLSIIKPKTVSKALPRFLSKRLLHARKEKYLGKLKGRVRYSIED